MKIVLTAFPTAVSRQLRSACSSVCSRSDAVFVNIAPTEYTRANRCVFNARTEAERGSGKCVLGWKILEWPKVLAHFIGHAVIEDSGTYKCVTPDLHGANRLLFLPDSDLHYNYTDPLARMPVRYVPYTDDESASDLISCFEQISQIKEKYPPTSGSIAITRDEAMQLRLLERQKLRAIMELASRCLDDYDRCVCDSGVRFGKCCKRKIEIELKRARDR